MVEFPPTVFPTLSIHNKILYVPGVLNAFDKTLTESTVTVSSLPPRTTVAAVLFDKVARATRVSPTVI